MKKPRVLVIHNQYQHRGGEDTVVEAEVSLLLSNGHEVETWFRNNDDITRMSSLSLARNTLWAGRTRHELTTLIKNFQPDIIHVHNTFPLISPSLYWAAARADVPVVQTLHNFRLMCLNALFLREGKVCEDCLGHLPWRGVARSCYRESRPASAVLAGMLVLHRALGTYRNKVTRYIALNEFCRRKFIEGGLPADRVVVKPNFVDFTDPKPAERNGLLFVGRLSAEKGVAALAEAIKRLPTAQLRVAGDGPEAGLLEDLTNVTHLGNVPSDTVRQEMNQAIALVVPSICFETFGLVVIEAYATSTPVIASCIGALAELVRDGQTGLLFEPGNPIDLAEKLTWALAHPEQMAVMGRNARAQYENEFSARVNYQQLLEIYESVLVEQKSA